MPPATLLAELDSSEGEADLVRTGRPWHGAICRRYQPCGDLTIAYDKGAADQPAARKALYPTLYRFDPRKKPINFVDDVVVCANASAN